MNLKQRSNLIHRSEFHKVYVIEFASGIVKVGHSISSKLRIWKHGHDALRRNDQISRTWISTGHTNAVGNERHLIDFCQERWETALGREYFADADFDLIVKHAQSLSYAQVSQEEIDSYWRDRNRELDEITAAKRAERERQPQVEIHAKPGDAR